MVLTGALIAVLAAADDSCRGCHPAQTAAFRSSPMGRSLGTAAAGAAASFRHGLSGTQAFVRGRKHTLTRNGITATHEAAYQIGSGSHGRGFLVRIGGSLFQSPVAEYPRDKRWDLAPGYETMSHPDFNRRVTGECLHCHASGSPAAPEAIGCERCHGPPDGHLRDPRRETIVNPARLGGVKRDAVCEQCHLGGEARIPNPGRTVSDYEPGQRPEDTYAVYIFDRPRADLRVISHVEQLALSRCAPKLACGTCHAPHGAAIDVNAQCRNCHGGPMPAGHPGDGGCSGCHMPKRAASDGGHTAFTDHRIARPSSGKAMPGGAREAALKAWREPTSVPLRQRNRGLALISVGERDRNNGMIQEGYKLLRAAFPHFERDPDVLAGLGMVLFLKDQHADAAKLMEAAARQRPDDASLQEKLAVVLRAAGAMDRAGDALERAIALDPSRETAYYLLGEIRPSSNALDRYLQFNPQSLIAREARQRLTR